MLLITRRSLAHVCFQENSPYEGGKFDVDIVIPEAYPFSAPKMRFIT